MARYIDADKLKDEFCKSCSTHKRYYLTVEQCRAREKEQPDRKWCFKMRLIDNTSTADVVKVVRCGKCKYGDVGVFSKTKDGQEDIACYCNLKKKVTDIDWYCPNGEGRDASRG